MKRGKNQKTKRSSAKKERPARKAARFANISSEKNSIVTSEDTEEAARLEDAMQKLGQLYEAQTAGGLRATWLSASEAFESMPNLQTLAAAKAARLEYRFFAVADTQIRVKTRNLIGKFFVANCGPFAARILERALAIAEKTLDDVASRESARVVELTGELPTQDNDIVVAARRAVTQLTALLEDARNTKREMLHLRPRRILSLFGFGPRQNDDDLPGRILNAQPPSSRDDDEGLFGGSEDPRIVFGDPDEEVPDEEDRGEKIGENENEEIKEI